MPSLEDQIAREYLDFSVQKLDLMTKYLDSCLDKLTDQQVWQRGADHENAVGHLVLHLCGNMRQWILHGVGGEPDVRTRELEFDPEKILSGSQLRERFHSSVDEARAVISDVTAARLVERTQPQGRDTTVLGAIYQVVGHVQQHVGQIILLTKQMTASDLDLTIPRPRSKGNA